MQGKTNKKKVMDFKTQILLANYVLKKDIISEAIDWACEMLVNGADTNGTKLSNFSMLFSSMR